MALSARQVVEVFHLTFLRALVAKGEDKSLIALKGGCNLRFYFGSVRYSEDIDFDVGVMGKETLRNKVERVLRSPILLSSLSSKGIEITQASAPRQTETTQRWKVGLRVEGIQLPLNTKVEFSRRHSIEGAVFEGIDRGVLRAYGLTPSLANHYATHAAITQKLQALAGRAEPQARDVFDLNVLFARNDAAGLVLDATQKGALPRAVENAMSISFDEYRSKVFAYLEPSQGELYADRSTWDVMQETVVERLEALQ